MSSVGFQPVQVEAVRARLRKMSDADLLRFGRAAASLCPPEGQFGHPPRQVFMDQLQEARAESCAETSRNSVRYPQYRRFLLTLSLIR
jgi:hypothetical protein